MKPEELKKRLASILNNEAQLDGDGVRPHFAGLLGAMSRWKAKAAGLETGLTICSKSLAVIGQDCFIVTTWKDSPEPTTTWNTSLVSGDTINAVALDASVLLQQPSLVDGYN